MPAPIETDCDSVNSRLNAGEPFLLLDCRELEEWNIARIEGARLLPMSELPHRTRELEPYQQQPVIVYCHHGARSLQVASWLRQQGFPEAQSMAGGIDHWSQTIDQTVPRY